MKEEVKILYRYEREYAHFDDGQLQAYKIILKEYEVWKITPCGYWINKPRYIRQKGKFILSGTTGKRFAYATKEDARESFKIRTRKSLMHCKSALKNAEIFSGMLKDNKVKQVVEYSF